MIALAAVGLLSLFGSDSSAGSGADTPAENRPDPEDRVRSRYVDGDLDDEAFERELERVLDAEDRSTAGCRRVADRESGGRAGSTSGSVTDPLRRGPRLAAGTNGRKPLECYVDGMGKRVTELFLREANRDYLRDPDLLRRAKGNARFVDGRDGQRKRIAEQNTVIVATSRMLGNEDPLAVAAS